MYCSELSFELLYYATLILLYCAVFQELESGELEQAGEGMVFIKSHPVVKGLDRGQKGLTQ